jgi:hypothetical protein
MMLPVLLIQAVWGLDSWIALARKCTMLNIHNLFKDTNIPMFDSSQVAWLASEAPLRLPVPLSECLIFFFHFNGQEFFPALARGCGVSVLLFHSTPSSRHKNSRNTGETLKWGCKSVRSFKDSQVFIFQENEYV